MKIWIEINETRLATNFCAIRRLLTSGQAPATGNHSSANPAEESLAAAPALLAVVKANAYGHGIGATAPTLARSGAEWLGVTDAQEGIAVRHALASAGMLPDRQPRILVMSGLTNSAAEAEATLANHLTPVVWTLEHLSALATAHRRLHHAQPIPIHLEIDTGMARQGVQPGPALAAILQAVAHPDSHLQLDGVFTHFASTEVAHSHQTAAQRLCFEDAVTQIRQAAEQTTAANLQPGWLHVGNSSYLDNGADADHLTWLSGLAATIGARPMVRSGLALYGYLLPLESESETSVVSGLKLESPKHQPAAIPASTPQPLLASSILPVLTWKTRVIALRDLAPNETVGYNGIFVADRPMRLALLPVGYADGLRRELSASNLRPGGWVILHGQRAPILGRVSMNLTVVDITAIPDVHVGDEATLLGDGISATDHAHLAHTIAYEILCNLKTSA